MASTEQVLSPQAADNSTRLDFLYHSLADNQEVIRFLDAKVGIGLGILSYLFGRLLGDLHDFFPWLTQPLWRQILFLLVVLFSVLAAAVALKIVFPANNPTEHVELESAPYPPFFIAGLRAKRWQRMFSSSPLYSCLALTHAAFRTGLNEADEPAFVRSMSAEVLKVSYIRQIKADRFKAFVWLLTTVVVLFAALVVGNELFPKQKQNSPVQVAPVTIQGPVQVESSKKENGSSGTGRPCTALPRAAAEHHNRR